MEKTVKRVHIDESGPYTGRGLCGINFRLDKVYALHISHENIPRMNNLLKDLNKENNKYVKLTNSPEVVYELCETCVTHPDFPLLVLGALK